MQVVSAAFGDVQVWATVNSWDIKIETTPKRTLVLSDEWVTKNIQPAGQPAKGILPDELQEKLATMTENQWARESNGNLVAVLRHPDE
jgi:hypothetical protein